MTNILTATENKLSGFYERLKKNKQKLIITALLLYTVLFLIFFFIAMGRVLVEKGYVLGGDGIELYVAALTQFRRDMITFFDSVASGSPTMPMVDLDYGFGMDSLGPPLGYFMSLCPYYIFCVALPESAMASFLTGGMAILSYLSGITMIVLCVHFGKDPLLSAAVSPIYVFCAWYTTNGWPNPHFLYASVAFPLMIVGMDRIINGKNGVLLALAVAYPSLCGIVMLFYTMPFVIIFAVIRVYYVHKGAFWRNLGKYFIIGTLYTLLGMLTASFALLPGIGKMITGSRMTTGTTLDIAAMFIPDISGFSRTFRSYNIDMYNCYGSWLASMLLLVYSVTCPGAKKELRTYGIVSIILMLLPLSSYIVNAFKYELCRWGFVPAVLLCYLSAEYAPVLIKPKEKETSFMVIVCAFYLFAVSVDTGYKDGIIIIAGMLICLIPPLRRLAAAAGKKIAEGLRKLISALKGPRKYDAILVLFIMGVTAITAVLFFVAANRQYIQLVAVLTISLFAGAVLLAHFTKHSLPSVILTICAFSVSGLAYLSDINGMVALRKDEHEVYFDALAKDRAENNVEGRYGSVHDVANNIFPSTDESKRYLNFDASDLYENQWLCDLNSALHYGIPAIEIFNSSISGDYIGFLDRIGMDGFCLRTPVETKGFNGKEVVYSLFGVRNMYTADKCPYIYGAQTYREIPVRDHDPLLLYTNDYALPLGVTYDRTMSQQRYDSLDSASLPYAMMNEIWLDGYGGNGSDAGTVYSNECEIELDKRYRGSTESGTRCYDNTVKINTDTAGFFLYISFDGVRSGSAAIGYANDFFIDMDNGMTHSFMILNPYNAFQWKYYMDHYTLSLGYHDYNIKELNFISPFDYDSVKVYTVPVSLYTDAYEQRCKETLVNVETGINTFSGSIDLSSDKILSVNVMYSRGWKVYDNGTEVPVYKANGLFMGMPLSAGHHDIRFVYRPPLQTEGAVASCVGIAIIIVISVISSKRKKERNQAK